MKLTDVVAVIGVKSRATEVAEALCRSFGMRFFYAVKETYPSQRIESCNDDATVDPSFEDVPEHVFRLGLVAANQLYEDGTIDCNFTEEREMLTHLLGWIVPRIESPADLPPGWALLNILDDPMRIGFERQLYSAATGQILSDGRIVVDLGQGKCFLQMADEFRDVFSLIEDSRF